MRRTATLAVAMALATGLPVHAQTGQPLTAPGPQGDLAGTLVMPEGAQAVVLIIPGSGPTDRDGNSPHGITATPYRLLAEGLAEDGIASLRIDKRGMFGSKAAVPDANAVTVADYAADIATWAARLRETQGEQCLYLLGHSEGGVMALAAAPQIDDLCGIILMTTPGRPMGTVLREQLQANPANAQLLPDAIAAIDSLEKGQIVNISAMHPALQQMFDPAVQPFLIDMMAHDPAALAAEVTVPLLIVQGGRDMQITEDDAAALNTARPDSTFILIPQMNHVLKTVDGDDLTANIATYADPSLPLVDNLVPAIVEFVEQSAADRVMATD